jgi:hypothetical protein
MLVQADSRSASQPDDTEGTEVYRCQTGTAVCNNDGDTVSLFEAAGDLVDQRGC